MYANGMKTESTREINTRGLRFSFRNSHSISLSNPLASRHTPEIILQAFFTCMGLRYLQSVFHKGSYNFSDRQIKIVELQPVVILDGEMGFMETALQDPCGLGGVGKRKTEKPPTRSAARRRAAAGNSARAAKYTGVNRKFTLNERKWL